MSCRYSPHDSEVPVELSFVPSANVTVHAWMDHNPDFLEKDEASVSADPLCPSQITDPIDFCRNEVLQGAVVGATGGFNRNSSRGKLDLASQNGLQANESHTNAIETRIAKTAPSTPEAEVKTIIKNGSKTSSSNQLEMSITANSKSNKTPSPEMPNRPRNQSESPVLASKTRRNEKFHKVFRNVPESEELIKQFSCAYVSDILLQGTLYITENFICFHSKIVGRKKLIEIPVDKVVAITREKTAFFIPNAIGVVTDTEKCVFGSLISRDNTYRLMYSMWRKKACSVGLAKDDTDVDGAPEIESYSSPENNNFIEVRRTDSGTAVDLESTTDTDSCISCNTAAMELDPVQGEIFQPVALRKHSQKRPKEVSTLPKSNQETTYSRMLLPYVLLCFDYEGNYKAICQFLTKLRRTARMNLLLAGCAVMILFFILSATVLAYKVMLLEVKMEGHKGWSADSKYSLRSHLYKNLYTLHNEYQVATIEKLHAILRANINILEDVYLSLKTLQESQRAGMKFCQQGYQSAKTSEQMAEEESKADTNAPDRGS